MQGITGTLEGHQRGVRRVPAVLVRVRGQRSGLYVLRWGRLYVGAEGAGPVAAVVAGDGGLIRARNGAGTLYTSRVASPGPGSTWSSWTTTGTGLLVGSGVALARSPGTGELLLAYTTGTALLVRTSSNDGASWSGATTVVTEGSNIGAIGAAFNPAGDCALFYVLGTSTTLKRLRRTGGTWAGSGTTWSRSSSVASLSGVAATHDGGDFQLVITGTEVTTGHPRAWGALMGDLGFPANVWSGLVAMAEADAGSGTSYASPGVGRDPGGALRATVAVTESGNVPFTRAMESAAPGGGATGAWTEPAPHEAGGGLALAAGPGAMWGVTPAGVWRAALVGSAEVSERVVSARYRITPTSAKCVVELDNGDGLLGDVEAFPGLYSGATLDVWPGYRSGAGGAAEYGVMLTFAIERLRFITERGRRTVRVEGVGGWELLGRWRAPQAWQVGGGVMSRGAIFQRIANRGGVDTVTGSVSADWGAYSPSFVLAQGESAASALRRLLSVVPDAVRSGELDGIVVVNPDPLAPATAVYGAGGHPVTRLTVIDEGPGANWVRLQGPDRYADEAEYWSVYQHGPALRTLRNLDASTNSRVVEGSEAALRREALERVCVEVVGPFDASLQLLDVVDVEGVGERRVIGVGLEYARGPVGARYDVVVELGAV